jgi:3-phosphoshikimate 1-carboxyvinyltransferase
MADISIEPSQLNGHLTVPPSKSHTLRAILFAALAKGHSRIEQVLPSPDSSSMMQAVCLLGARIQQQGPNLTIEGFAGRPHFPDDVIQCGNSGQVLRFIGALAGLIGEYTIITGDDSIRHNRPVRPLLDALQELGVFAASSRGDGYAPIIIKGPITKSEATLDGQDSQPVSGLLIAGAFAPHPIELIVRNPGEKPWIDLTLDWFRRLKIPYQAQSYTRYRMNGSAQIDGFHYTVPGDFSSAAFPIAAALITGSSLTLHSIDMDDVQGDKAILSVLEQMGASFTIDRAKRTLVIEKACQLKGMRIDINDFIDALPILAVIGCFAEGRTEIVNAAIARKKESDRISSIAGELKKMGARIEEKPDGLVIHQSELHGAELSSHHDHRIAMSLSVAALGAKSASVVQGIECTAKTYPSFYDDLLKAGAKIRR